jgi:hypothetical protein
VARVRVAAEPVRAAELVTLAIPLRLFGAQVLSRRKLQTTAQNTVRLSRKERINMTCPFGGTRSALPQRPVIAIIEM